MAARKLLVCVGLVLVASACCGQLVVGEGATVASGNNALLRLDISGDITIRSANTNLSKATLRLTGQSQTLSSTQVTLHSLVVDAQPNSTIPVFGEWNVLQQLQLVSGILVPDTTSAKIIFSGVDQPDGSDQSYVNGVFYSTGADNINFPIGNGAGYFPGILHRVNPNSTFGLLVAQGSARFATEGDITEVMNTRYYRLIADIGATNGATISLSTNGQDNLSDHKGLVVLQGSQLGNTPTSLNGQDGLVGFVTSTISPTLKYLTIGKSENPVVIIYDLITPFTQDGKNDKLKISNIGLSIENRVTLFDRWGALVKQWTNFKNYDDPYSPNEDNFDFTKLTPGNYICIAEYKLKAGDPMKKLAQMVTVLRAN